MKVAAKVMERFFAKVDFLGEGGCWLWTGNLKDGYGYIFTNSRQVRAHRFIYGIYNKAAPVPEVVRHKCDVRRCVNPEHLVGGTHYDNVMDRVARGRSAIGDRNKGGVKKGCARQKSISTMQPEKPSKKRPLNPKRRQRLIDMGLL